MDLVIPNSSLDKQIYSKEEKINILGKVSLVFESLSISSKG